MRRLVRELTRNVDLKVIALLLAALTWYYLVTAGIEERRFPGAVVRILPPPKDVALLSLDVRSVSLTLRGPRRELDALKARELFVEVDLGDLALSTAEPQSPRIPISNDHLRTGRDPGGAERLPAGVRLLRAEPDAIVLTLDRVKEVLLDVEVVTEGEPAPGFTLTRTAQQNKVKVRGPFRLLQTLSSIRTELIRVDGLSERQRRRVALQREVKSSEYGSVPIFPEPSSVQVVLDVVETPDEKTIERVPVRLAAVPKSVAVIKQEIREVTVKLRGPTRLLRDIDAPSLVAEISLDGAQAPAQGSDVATFFLLRENIRQVAGLGASATLAPGIELLEVKPKAVPLTLDRMSTRSLPVEAVLEGAPAEDHEITEKRVIPDKVSVRGPQSVLKELKAIETVPILITGLRERLRRTVGLVETVDVGTFRDVHIEPSRRLVDVVLAATERRVEKTLTGLPVHLVIKPEVALNIRVEMDRRTLGPVTFVGPRSRMEHFSADSVAAIIPLEITSAADLRPTIRNVEFYIRDPLVRLAPDSKPIPIKLEFPAPARSPTPPPKP